MNEYSFEVHYWYAAHGEHEKDHDSHTVFGNTLEEAIKKARHLYRFVFAIYHNGIKVYK